MIVVQKPQRVRKKRIFVRAQFIQLATASLYSRHLFFLDCYGPAVCLLEATGCFGAGWGAESLSQRAGGANG
jgi:hypothetical protein